MKLEEKLRALKLKQTAIEAEIEAQRVEVSTVLGKVFLAVLPQVPGLLRHEKVVAAISELGVKDKRTFADWQASIVTVAVKPASPSIVQD